MQSARVSDQTKHPLLRDTLKQLVHTVTESLMLCAEAWELLNTFPTPVMFNTVFLLSLTTYPVPKDMTSSLSLALFSRSQAHIPQSWTRGRVCPPEPASPYA